MLEPCIAAGLGIAHFAQDLLTAFEWTQALKKFIFLQAIACRRPVIWACAGLRAVNAGVKRRA